ncbi:dipicolinate synthase subunit B [Oscillospiraceae bacterium MB08-C2-2]|nr:dipicolinate synthase subunit B [Oscillospiraceae bacterium MB08-C2-2]
MDKIKVGFALTGSFCTFNQVITEIGKLVSKGYDVWPIMSEYASVTDTRFGRASDFINQLEGMTGHRVLSTIVETEPVGPTKMFDIMIIAPCTGNTLAKLANSITDTCVCMAAKSHLRNARPLVLAPSTNDALGGSAKNMGQLLNYKNIYFVPMAQDDAQAKPRSVVSDFTKIPQTLESALTDQQLQPILLGK